MYVTRSVEARTGLVKATGHGAGCRPSQALNAQHNAMRQRVTRMLERFL
jgi:hypothetical protein